MTSTRKVPLIPLPRLTLVATFTPCGANWVITTDVWPSRCGRTLLIAIPTYSFYHVVEGIVLATDLQRHKTTSNKLTAVPYLWLWQLQDSNHEAAERHCFLFMSSLCATRHSNSITISLAHSTFLGSPCLTNNKRLPGLDSECLSYGVRP